VRLASAFAWFLTGTVLWVGGSVAWQQWQLRRVAAASAAHPVHPASSANEIEASLYTSAAERILEAYRTSADPALADIDWHKAEIYLEHAVALGGGGDRALGQLALARGYATLERVSDAPYSDRAAAQLRAQAGDQFTSAAQRMPRDPAPHLALARLYVYAVPDAGRAMDEFAAAEKLGAVLGSREIEQKGDAYRLRAERDNPKDAAADAQRAIEFYQKIPGYDRADQHAKDLAQLLAAAAAEQQRAARPVRKSKRSGRRTAAIRRTRWR
jgi:hypothetical protein